MKKTWDEAVEDTERLEKGLTWDNFERWIDSRTDEQLDALVEEHRDDILDWLEARRERLN